jgi:hypothetical protein
MLFRETVAVYCEKHTEHTDTLCGQNAVYINSVRTSQEIQPNRSMLFGETVAVYYENHTEHTDTLCGQNSVYINSVRTSLETYYFSATKPNRLILFREDEYLFRETHKTQKYSLWAECAVLAC